MCKFCGTNCGSLTPGMPPEGDGSILIVLDEVTSEQDFGGTFYAGSNGRLLTDILKRAGLRREDCTVTSAYACLNASDQSSNKIAIPGHVSSIIALGDGAFKRMCRKSGIKDKRGQSFKLHKDFGIDADVWPTYGLGLVRRVPNYRNIVVADLQRVISQGRESEHIEWSWWDGQELPDSDVYSYDIETIPENFDGSNYTETATQCAVAGNGFCYVSRPNAASANGLALCLAELLRKDPSRAVVGHNSWNFDVPRTRKAGIEFPLGEDTMVLAYLEDETQPKGLESLCVKHLGIKGWKDEFEHPLGSDEFALYNARDVVYTLRLYNKYGPILGDRIKLVVLILKPAFIALSGMSERGIYIDPAAVARERAKAEIALAGALIRIREIVGATEFIPTFIGADGKYFGEEQLAKWKKSFNPGSTKQVGEFLELLGVDLPSTATGKPDTSVKVLQELQLPITKAILDYRGAKKTLGTYCSNYEKIIQADGRVHNEYKITRTLTGRSSAVNQNVQNLPREYKDFFGAPPGHVFCEVDWSAIEFRVAAWVAQEPTILGSFERNANWDPHRFFAARFYGITEDQVTKDQRQIAKSANFGLLYLGTGFTLVEYAKGLGITLSLPTADALYRQWHDTFPGMRKLYKETKDEIIRTSEARTATGFIRHFGDISIMPPHLRSEALRQGVNVKVQGFAAHIAYVAMARLHELEMPLTGFIHDSFLFEFTSEEECKVKLPIIEDVMCNYPRAFFLEHFGFDLNVPLTVEAKSRKY